jgi:DNA invertase Pin-like site-specific DNA recombinase
MSVIAYSRISTDQQDLEKQKHLLLQYAQKQGWLINEFIEVSISSRKNTKQRKIDELLEKLQSGDVLLVAELSRLGRNMLETLNIINTLSETGIKIVFVRQPELSTTATHAKLLLAIYSYFAESERDYISIRTKQGLAAAKAMGKQLGRPKGSKNKKGRILDNHKPAIKKYLELGVTISDITKIINDLLETPITYNAFKYFIKHDEDLASYMKK